MGDEADRFRKELERLKSKYRKEAMRAVEEARSEGYMRGMQEQREKELVKVKNKIDATVPLAGNNSTTNIQVFAVQLVHDSVEQVYKDLKYSWAASERLSMQQIKASVLASTKKLLAEIPNHVNRFTELSEDVKIKDNPNGHEFTNKSKVDLPFQLLHTCAMPRQFVSANVTATSGNVVKGVFIDGQFVSYTVTLEVGDLRTDYYCTPPSKFRRFSIDTRTSDLKILHGNLVKEQPWSIIPAVPNKKYKIEAFSKNPHRPKKEEQKHLYRKRMYSLWLQFLANIESLQNASTLRSFLCLPHQEAAEELMNSLEASSQLRTHLICLHSSEFCFDKQRKHGPASERLRGRCAVFTDTDFSAVDHESLSKNEIVSFDGEHDKTEGEVRLRISDIQNSAYKDLRSVDSASSALLRESTTVIQSCWKMVHSWCELSHSIRELGDSFSQLRTVEPVDSLESVFIGSVSDRCYETNLCSEGVGEVLQCSITEPVEFLLGDCARNAKDKVEAALRANPVGVFLSDKPYYTLYSHRGNEPSSESKVQNAAIVELKRVQCGISCAVAVAKGWDNYKKVRSAMLINQLIVAARALADQHAAARKVWESALVDLSHLNVTTSRIGVDGEERGSGSYFGGHGSDLTSPALEHVTSSLKQAIESELHGHTSWDETIEQRTDNHERTVMEEASHGRNLNDHQNKDGLQHNIQTQAGCEESHFQQNLPAAVVPVKKGLPGALAGFGNLLSLKSFRAVFTRAKVPSGKRRNPSVAKPVDFGQTNEEEKLAASYNRKREIDDVSTTRTRDDHEPDVRQQAQRQNRLAARRQAAVAHAGNGPGAAHVTSKIKTNVGVAATAPAPSASVFGAAPQPAAPVRLFAAHISEPESGSAKSTDVNTSRPSSDPALAVPDVSKPWNEGKSDRTSESNNVTSSKSVTSKQTNSLATNAGNKSNYSKKPSPVLTTPASTSTETCAKPMPSGWVEVKMEDGGVYYYHTVTRTSRWDRPTEEVAAALEARIQQANAKVDDALQRHKEEREQERRQQEERDQQIDKLRSKVKNIVDMWAFGRVLGMVAPKIISGPCPTVPAARDFLQLLSTLHEVIPYIPDSTSVVNVAVIPQPPSIKTCPPAEIKKAYMRAVRFVHPDKLPDDLTLETRMVAEAVFIVLTDSFNQYRAAANNG